MLLDRLSEETHVWLATPGTDVTAQPALLSADERARHARFYAKRDADLYLAAHVLLRTTLSRYCDLPPQAWRFRSSATGRPEIGNPDTPPLRFSLTHTAGLTACVVTLGLDCGIDAERLDERRHATQIAQRLFSPAECEALKGLDEPARLERFYAGWTLREAYGKGLGLGLRYPTREIRFAVAAGGSSTGGDFQVSVSDRPDWMFQLFRPMPHHLAAIAVRCGANQRRRVVHRRVGPGQTSFRT